MGLARLPGSLVKSTNVDPLPSRHNLLRIPENLRSIPDISAVTIVGGLQGIIPESLRGITDLVGLGIEPTTDAFLSALPERTSLFPGPKRGEPFPVRWFRGIQQRLQGYLKPVIESLYEWAPEGYVISMVAAGAALTFFGDISPLTMVSLPAVLPVFGGVRRVSRESGKMLVRLAEIRLDMYEQSLKRLRMMVVHKIDTGESNEAIADWLEAEVAPFTGLQMDLEMVRKCLQDKGLLNPPLALRFQMMIHDHLGNDMAFLSNVGVLLRGKNAEELRIFLWRTYSSSSPEMLPLFKRVMGKLTLLAQENGVHLRKRGEMAFAPHVPLELVEDLLKNLVENSTKYSDSSEPDPFVMLTHSKTTGNLVVQDNGIGMDAAFVERLGSEPIREGRKVETKGTGTGWIIIAGVLEMLGWSWRVESAIGEGTKVVMKVPQNDVVPGDSVPIQSVLDVPKISLRTSAVVQEARAYVEQSVELVREYLRYKIGAVLRRHDENHDPVDIMINILQDIADGGRTFEVIKSVGRIVKWHSRVLGGDPYYASMKERYLVLYQAYRALIRTLVNSEKMRELMKQKYHYVVAINQVLEGSVRVNRQKIVERGINVEVIPVESTVLDHRTDIDFVSLEQVLDRLLVWAVDQAGQSVILSWNNRDQSIRISWDGDVALEEIPVDIRGMILDKGWSVEMGEGVHRRAIALEVY